MEMEGIHRERDSNTHTHIYTHTIVTYQWHGLGAEGKEEGGGEEANDTGGEGDTGILLRGGRGMCV